MDWNISCSDCGNVFDWIYRVFMVFTYPIFCDYYVGYKSDETLLSLGFEYNM